MADVDSLSIQISADAAAADAALDILIEKLGRLGASLGSLNRNNTFQLNFEFAGDMTKKVDRLQEYISKSAKQMSNELSKAFNVDRTSAKDMERLIMEFGNAASKGDGDNMFRAYEALGNSIISIGSSTKEADDQMQKFYKTLLATSKIRISPDTARSLGDAWTNRGGIMLQKFSTKEGMELDSLMQEWKSNFEGIFDGLETDTVEGQFHALSEVIERCRQGMESMSKADFEESVWDDVNQKASALSKNIAEIKQALEATGGTTESGGIGELASAFQKFGKIDASQFVTIANGIRELSSGISSLNGISFNADAITSITAGIKKLGNIKPTEGISNLTQISSNLSGFVQSMNSVGSLTFDVGSLTGLINGLTQLGYKSATQATANLKALSSDLTKFISEMNGLQSVNFDTTGIAALADAIKQLGYKSADKAIENIPKLSKAMKELMTTLSGAPRVSQNLIDMTNALANLSRTGASSGRAANSLSKSMDSYTASAGKAKKASGGLASALGKMYATYWLVFRSFGKFKDAIDIASDLTEVQNVVDVTFGDMAYKVEDFAKNSIEQFGMSELSLKTYASRFQAMGSAMNIDSSSIASANEYLNEQTRGYIGLGDSMADVSLNLTKLTADMASFYNQDQKDIADDLAAIFTGQTEPLRRWGIDLTEATLKEWALTQGMNANIQTMTQAEKVMLRYQYVLAHTGAAQNDFSRNANTWANQVRILKQNFEQLASVVGGVFINALKPMVQALNAAMSHVIAFAEVVSNALGKIFGWEYQVGGGGVANDLEVAAGAADDVAGGMGDAAKSAKEMKLGLAAFDEINNLTTSDDSGGSGGSGGGSALDEYAGGDGGQWAEVESMFEKYKSNIDTLFELGQTIGDALKDAMNSINWESVYQGARNFGKGLADFLNGLISPELFGALGRTIAGALNTAIYAVLSFGQTFDWAGFGLSIATGINEFFKTFDFAALAETINVWALGILKTMLVAIENTDWELIGTQIGTFLAGIDFLEIGMKVAELFWEGIKAGFKMWKGSFDVAPIETILASILALPALVGFGAKIIGLIANPFTKAFGVITSTISGMSKVLSSFAALFAEGGALAGMGATVGVAAAAITALAAGLAYVYATNEDVRSSFSAAVDTIEGALAPSLEFITGQVLPDLKAGWDGLLEILEPFGRFLKNTFTSIWQDMINPALTRIGTGVLPEVTKAFESLWNDILVPLASTLKDILTPAIELVSEVLTILWENIVVPLAQFIGEVFATTWENISKLFYANIAPAIEFVIKTFQFLWNNVLVPVASYLLGQFEPTFRSAFETIGNLIDNLKVAFTGLMNFVTGVLTVDWEQAWMGMQDVFRGVFNGIIDIAEFAVNRIIRGLNRLSIDVPDWIPEIGGKTFGFDIQEISLPRFAEGGFPDTGQLFMARERGPELVGTIGGSTAVANNDQIVEAISQGVYMAFASASTKDEDVMYNAFRRAMQDTEFTAVMDTDRAFRSMQKKATEYNRRTGKPAFGY